MRRPNYKKAEIKTNNDFYQGQSIERYIEQAETTKQPIEGGAPMIYTARKDGVRAEFNIRTDRFALAQKAMDKVSATYTAQRNEWLKSQETKESETA